MRRRGLLRLLRPVAGAATVATVASSACVQPAAAEPLPSNPLKAGMPEAQLQAYVTRLLKDIPACNTVAIPDSIERQVYGSVVRLIVDSIYHALGGLHGVPLLGNQICLHLSQVPPPPPTADPTPVSREALDAVVTRLLANESLNYYWLPDRVERQLYLNVLHIAFSVIDDFAAAISLSLLGFELVLDLRPKPRSEWVAASGLHHKVDETLVARLTDAQLARTNQALIPDALERQLYSNIYRLTMSLLNEVFDSVGLQLFGSEISLELRPSMPPAESEAPAVPVAGSAEDASDGGRIDWARCAQLEKLDALRREERSRAAAHQMELEMLRRQKAEIKLQLSA